jgi:spore maturation protein CgeB
MKKPRVLLTGPEWYGDLLLFCERAFAQLDVPCRVLPVNQAPWLEGSGRRRQQIARIPWAGPKIDYRLHSREREKLGRDVRSEANAAVKEWKPDLLLSLACWRDPLHQEFLEGLRGIRKIGWFMDDPFLDDGSLSAALPGFDISYSVDESWVAPMQLLTSRPIHFLPCGADPKAYYPVDPKSVPGHLKSEVVFVGSSYGDLPAGLVRRSLLRELGKLDLAVYGDGGWKRSDRDGEWLSRCFKGMALATENTNLAYNGARIALNIHHPQFRQGTSLRTFAICATGALQFVDWRPNLEAFFALEEEVVAYRSPEELREKAARYLKDETRSRAIARAGYERVLREHTYQHRIERMLRDVSA